MERENKALSFVGVGAWCYVIFLLNHNAFVSYFLLNIKPRSFKMIYGFIIHSPNDIGINITPILFAHRLS